MPQVTQALGVRRIAAGGCVVGARDAILRARTLLINSARGIAKGFGLRLPQSITSTFGKRALADVPAMLQTALGGLLEQIDALSQRIGSYNQQAGELAERHPELERLTSIPGVGELTAITFVLTLGRPERFAHSRDVAGFLGLRLDNWRFPPDAAARRTHARCDARWPG